MPRIAFKSRSCRARSYLLRLPRRFSAISGEKTALPARNSTVGNIYDFESRPVFCPLSTGFIPDGITHPASKCAQSVLRCAETLLKCSARVLKCTETVLKCSEHVLKCTETVLKCSEHVLKCSETVLNCS